MAEPDITFPYPAHFVPIQKGTNLLQDVDNYTNRVHENCEKKKTTTYRCTERMSAKCPALATLDSETKMIVNVSLCHRGGRMENINAWYLNTHMVYL